MLHGPGECQAGRGREWRGRELMNDAQLRLLSSPPSLLELSSSRWAGVVARPLVGSRAWDRGTGRREAEGHSHLLSG